MCKTNAKSEYKMQKEQTQLKHIQRIKMGSTNDKYKELPENVDKHLNG